MRLLAIFALVFSLSACQTIPPCFTGHSPSISVVDGEGNIKADIKSTITKVCPGYITTENK